MEPKSKHWPEFVNLYRAIWGTNAGMEKAKEFTDKQMERCIYALRITLNQMEGK